MAHEAQSRRTLGSLLVLLTGSLIWASCGGNGDAFAGGLSLGSREVQVALGAHHRVKAPVEKRLRFEGTTKRLYLHRLRHRRWCAQFPYPRRFGFVWNWNDRAGEGIIKEAETKQKYLVIRDEIGACQYNHKTLACAEMVEFFCDR
mmetsp:Transcript_81410/g.143733  ORF Transcript_81410/g.143733 Transcript_81410/m.143733 type:complete len:146 (-) Transcript_81410:329-766(-)